MPVEKAREAGKPDAMLDKIAEGTVQKYLKEVTLLGQPFVKEDGKVTIEQLLKSRVRRSPALRFMWLARASRRSRTTLPQKWLLRPLPLPQVVKGTP